MELQYINYFENTDLQKSYTIFDENENEIGSAEAFGTELGFLVTVIKIFNPKFQKMGLGFQAFKKVFDEISHHVPITVIVGSWHRGGEFQEFEDGMSSNMKVFRESQNERIEDRAFSTPTGKWAKRLGFNNCRILSNGYDEVTVHFTKE